MVDDLSDLFEQQQEEFLDSDLAGATSPDDIFSIFEKYEDIINAVSVPSDGDELGEEDQDRARKKLKVSPQLSTASEGSMKMSHITVERNRRKQMNEHLSVLRSLMPSFYVKRGDQASIIGGVIDYIKELQQVLQSLEAKKQRKAYSNEVLSPRPAVPSSPRPSPLSPRPPPPSPRMALPPTISPRTPQPGSPYCNIKPRLIMQQISFNIQQLSPKAALVIPHQLISPGDHRSPPAAIDMSGGGGGLDQLAAAAAINAAKSPAADVEVKFSGANVLVKTVSRRIPGQALKIIAALDGLALEILHVSVSTIDDTLLNSFTIKIGIECQLSAEELAQEIQQTFSS